jgi:serine/threonine protein kinase/Flp pilus assembly protein TadD
MHMPAAITVCSTCSEPLNGKGECLACLLRGGLNESVEEQGVRPDSLVFGDFEIALRDDGSLWELGCGAMGITYRAIDRVLHRTVALKVIEAPSAGGDSKAVRERFLREARAAAALKHPNVAGIFQFGASPEINRCYYAMELVEGETLEALIRRDGPLKVELALEIAIQVTRALIGAATQGLIHRDLKPGNIMITRPDTATAEMEAKVIDFGLAKATNAVAETDLTHGGFVGTPSFASPEQFGGAPADARSDIYSLGVTLWYSLTGQVPYPGKTIEEIRDRQQQTDLPVEQLIERKIPAPLIDMLRRTLALDPIQRPASARELLAQLERCQLRSRKRNALIAAGTFAILVLVAFFAWQMVAPKKINEKSIAVLPFENLSGDKENAYFAGGMQDEILSDLAQIADLKVISRTSVMRYQSGTPRNLREIAQSLGVANIVEGSVQRNGPRVRVVAQLIDVRTDTHRWSKTYDRALADIFALQDEIAQQIAHELQAKIAPQEKTLIAEKPTSDLTAYAFYERARALDRMDWKDRQKCAVLLEEAVRRDPNFLLAHCRLAEAYVRLYAGQDMESEDERMQTAARAREEIETALRLRPDRGEPHLASAQYFFMTFQAHEARRELEIVSRLMPNDSEALFLEARLDRRENRWDEAVVKARRAADLDPQNEFFVSWTAETYLLRRRYHEGEEFLGEFKTRNPAGAKLFDSDLARFKLAQGNLAEALALSRYPTDETGLETQFSSAFFAKDYPAALRIIAEAPPYLVEQTFCLNSPESRAEAQVFRARGEREKAQRIFQKLRQSLEEHSANTPRNEWYFANCSQFDAALGQTDDAIREAQKAVEMHPIAQDPINGTTMVVRLAKAYTVAGDRGRALEQLEMLAKIPSDISYGELRFNPEWDSLRGEPRFEKIIASLEPKKIDN